MMPSRFSASITAVAGDSRTRRHPGRGSSLPRLVVPDVGAQHVRHAVRLDPAEVRHGQHVRALRGVFRAQAQLLEDLRHRLAQRRFRHVDLVLLGNLEALENHGSLLTGKDSPAAPAFAVHPSRFSTAGRRRPTRRPAGGVPRHNQAQGRRFMRGGIPPPSPRRHLRAGLAGPPGHPGGLPPAHGLARQVGVVAPHGVQPRLSRLLHARGAGHGAGLLQLRHRVLSGHRGPRPERVRPGRRRRRLLTRTRVTRAASTC